MMLSINPASSGRRSSPLWTLVQSRGHDKALKRHNNPSLLGFGMGIWITAHTHDRLHNHTRAGGRGGRCSWALTLLYGGLRLEPAVVHPKTHVRQGRALPCLVGSFRCCCVQDLPSRVHHVRMDAPFDSATQAFNHMATRILSRLETQNWKKMLVKESRAPLRRQHRGGDGGRLGGWSRQERDLSASLARLENHKKRLAKGL